MQHINPENLIIIDIETASENPSFAHLSEEWKALWQEKVNRSLPEGVSAPDFYPMRAGVMAEFAKIICISIAYFNKETTLHMRVKSFYGHDEKKILTDFLTTINKIESLNSKWCFAGHNIKEFDIPYLCRRFLINRISIPSLLDFQDKKPWEIELLDTLQLWKFGDYKNFTSLKLLTKILGIPSSKGDIDGSQVGHVFYVEKDIDRIVTYCEKDVIAVAQVFLRFRKEDLLIEDEIIHV